MLGTVIGARDARVAFLRSAIETMMKKMTALRPLQHQSALLLLRKCLSSDLRHLQRILRTDDMLEEWDPPELAIWKELKRLRGRPNKEGGEGIDDREDVLDTPGSSRWPRPTFPSRLCTTRLRGS